MTERARIVVRVITLVCVSGWILTTFVHNNSNRCSNNNNHNNIINNNNDSFDFYVLALTLSAEFCYEHRSAAYPGCVDPRDDWRGRLTLHGLWPQRTDGSWPQFCGDDDDSTDSTDTANASFDPSVVDAIGRDRFERDWPNVEAPTYDGTQQQQSQQQPLHYYDLWDHEWTKHGTCSGLSQDAYFRTALDDYESIYYHQNNNNSHQNNDNNRNQTPPLPVDTLVPRQTLVDALGGPNWVALVCHHGHYLSEVRVCIGRDGTTQIPCIESVLVEDTCDGDTVFISDFSSASAATATNAKLT